MSVVCGRGLCMLRIIECGRCAAHKHRRSPRKSRTMHVTNRDYLPPIILADADWISGKGRVPLLLLMLFDVLRSFPGQASLRTLLARYRYRVYTLYPTTQGVQDVRFAVYGTGTLARVAGLGRPL